MSATAGLKMPKSPGRPKGDRDDVTIRVSRALASKLKAIANDRGNTVAEVADELFATVLDRAYAQMLRRLEGEDR
jgi:hypothetical protein